MREVGNPSSAGAAGATGDRRRTVLISGASVAGPALAYWLARHGWRTTVIEVAPALRGGGFAVDFRGAAHLAVLERMGILAGVREHRTTGSPLTFIDAQGDEIATLPEEFAGGDLEILRSDLSRLLHDHSRKGHGPSGAASTTSTAPEYVFGDSIASLTETDDGVHVTFERGAPRTFDLVVGADGLHSTVRRLAFGPEKEFVSHLGYYVAAWDLPAGAADLAVRPVGYGEPGRLASVGRMARREGEAGYAGEVFCVFASAELDCDRRDIHAQKKAIAQAYEGAGWRTPELIETLWGADDFYFDSISRADVPRWSTSMGRIVLLGDAAYSATVGGMGTGAAIVGAYVLAGELAAAGGEAGADIEGDADGEGEGGTGGHREAFARYERRMRPYVTACQEGGAGVGAFMAPPTQEAIDARNAALNDPATIAAILEGGTELSAAITLEPYPELMG
ncbi:FAD-dependent monooxygenase [Streptomyces sp. NPDC101393]|uniref:FAD-dependent monooxygenase n=1 Tax=Streptomyces sp. NPDC101393 TaxID=3366141 RepID=UPI00382DCCE9